MIDILNFFYKIRMFSQVKELPIPADLSSFLYEMCYKQFLELFLQEGLVNINQLWEGYPHSEIS